MASDAETTKLSSKGQVVLPSSIRRSRNWTAGTEFTVQETPDGVLLKPLRRGRTRVEDVAGCLKVEGPPRSLEQMQEAVVAEIRKRSDRGRY